MTNLPPHKDTGHPGRRRVSTEDGVKLLTPPSGTKPAVFTGEFVIPGQTPEDLWIPHLERYRFASEIATGKKILDVACGTGYGSDYLAQRGAVKVVGGDISPEAIGYAKQHYRRQNLSFVKLNAGHLPFRPSSFDVVVSFETIEHMKDPGQFLKECSRVLRPGGAFVCSSPMRHAWRPPWVPAPLNPFHTREFSFAEMRTALSEHFDNLELFGQASGRPFELILRYVAFTSALILTLIPGTKTLAGRARDMILNLWPRKSPFSGSKSKNLFDVRPLREARPGFPGIIIVRAGRGT